MKPVSSITVRCHRCVATTSVTATPNEVSRELGKRGWDNAHGAICCKRHPVRMMPRHSG